MNTFLQSWQWSDKEGKIIVEDTKILPDSKYAVLSLPFESEGEYKHNLLQAINNIYVQVLQGLDNNNPKMDGLSKDKIHLQKVYFLKELGNFLGYMNNCTSFRDLSSDTIHSFDKPELKARLERLISLL